MSDERTFKIIGAAMEVHRELGSGFLEGVYQEALEREFELQNIPFISQPVIEIKYKGKPLKKKYQPDSICYDEVLARPPRLSGSRPACYRHIAMAGRWRAGRNKSDFQSIRPQSNKLFQVK
jgi:hypothetical protein